MQTVLIVVAILIVVVFLIPFIVSIVLYNKYFGVTYTSSNHSTFRLKEFDGLERAYHPFKSNKGQNLAGYIYTNKLGKKARGCIVMPHGFGMGGHIGYLPDINYFTKHGYMVFAYDGTGNDESEGRSVIGMPQAIIDLDYAMSFVKEKNLHEGLPIVLYGHSWGGYAITALLCKRQDVLAVAERSGFNESYNIIIEQGIKKYGKWVRMIKPYIRLYEIMKFGKFASYSGLEGLKKSTMPVLVMHSEEDHIVSYENNFLIYKEALAQKINIKFVSFKGRYHSINLSEVTNSRVNDLWKQLAQFVEQYGRIGTIPLEVSSHVDEQIKACYKDLDLEVMAKIVAFYDDTIK